MSIKMALPSKGIPLKKGSPERGGVFKGWLTSEEYAQETNDEDHSKVIKKCLAIGALLFQAFIVPGIIGFLFHSGWVFTGFFLGQIVLAVLLGGLTEYLESDLSWDTEVIGQILISLPSGITPGALGWFLVSNFFHIDWLPFLVGVVFLIVTVPIIVAAIFVIGD